MKALDFVTILCLSQVPISGGGMTSGIALAAKNLAPNCRYDALQNKIRVIMLRKKKFKQHFLKLLNRVIAVEPQGKELLRCLQSKERL